MRVFPAVTRAIHLQQSNPTLFPVKLNLLHIRGQIDPSLGSFNSAEHRVMTPGTISISISISFIPKHVFRLCRLLALPAGCVAYSLSPPALPDEKCTSHQSKCTSHLSASLVIIG
eukprot:g6468.t1